MGIAESTTFTCRTRMRWSFYGAASTFDRSYSFAFRASTHRGKLVSTRFESV